MVDTMVRILRSNIQITSKHDQTKTFKTQKKISWEKKTLWLRMTLCTRKIWLCLSSGAQSCLTLCNPVNHSTPGLPVHHQLPEVTQTHVLQVGDAIQPSHPQSSLLLLPPIPPSIRVFSNESSLRMRWPKYWSFSFSIIPSNEHPGLISFRMDRLDLLAVQGTLKSLLQHHSSKASVQRDQNNLQLLDLLLRFPYFLN